MWREFHWLITYHYIYTCPASNNSLYRKFHKFFLSRSSKFVGKKAKKNQSLKWLAIYQKILLKLQICQWMDIPTLTDFIISIILIHTIAFYYDVGWLNFCGLYTKYAKKKFINLQNSKNMHGLRLMNAMNQVRSRQNTFSSIWTINDLIVIQILLEKWFCDLQAC